MSDLYLSKKCLASRRLYPMPPAGTIEASVTGSRKCCASGGRRRHLAGSADRHHRQHHDEAVHLAAPASRIIFQYQNITSSNP